MVRDRDQDAYGPVLLGKEVGTARIGYACCDGRSPKNDGGDRRIVWKNDRFGSWLVCQRPTSGLFELRWWDVVSNMGVDGEGCAKVDLVAVDIEAGNGHQSC